MKTPGVVPATVTTVVSARDAPGTALIPLRVRACGLTAFRRGFGKSHSFCFLALIARWPVCVYGRSESCSSPTTSRSVRSLIQSTDWGVIELGKTDFAFGAVAPAPAPLGFGLLAGAPQIDKVKKKLAETKILEAAKEKGDLHYTAHGCHCLLDWELDGKTMHGCNRANTSFSQGLPFCAVTKECERFEGKVEEMLWDFCVLDDEVDHHRTVHGCHCSPRFEYQGEIMHNCVKTSLGARWCYVFEGGNLCEEALRTEHAGQHWDYCFVESQTSSFVTRAGCHCMPEFKIDGVHYKGCSIIPGRERPGCLIFEDEILCPKAIPEPGTHFLYDECIFVGPKQGEEGFANSSLVSAGAEGCHCLPEWDYAGKQYVTCSGVENETQRTWCFVAEDARVCPAVDGVRDGQRWRYCGSGVFAETTTNGPLTTSASSVREVDIAFGQVVTGSHSCCGGSLEGLVDGDIGGDFAYRSTDRPSVVQVDLASPYKDVAVTLFNRKDPEFGSELQGTQVYLSPRTYEEITSMEAYLCGGVPDETLPDRAYSIDCADKVGQFVIVVSSEGNVALREIEATGMASLDGMWEGEDGSLAEILGNTWMYWPDPEAKESGGSLLGMRVQVMMAGDGGTKYNMYDFTFTEFLISAGFGGGSATYTPDAITFANGMKYLRQAVTTAAPVRSEGQVPAMRVNILPIIVPMGYGPESGSASTTGVAAATVAAGEESKNSAWSPSAWKQLAVVAITTVVFTL